MQKVTILRTSSTDQGTFGILYADNGFICHTGELPWRKNKSNLSCIPVGQYKCSPYRSRKFGHVYIIEDVDNRFGVLFHPGNFFGDKKKKYLTHSWGCILLGKMRGKLNKQDAVLVSRPTVRKFFEAMNYKTFILTIKKVY